MQKQRQSNSTVTFADVRHDTRSVGVPELIIPYSSSPKPLPLKMHPASFERFRVLNRVIFEDYGRIQVYLVSQSKSRQVEAG